VDVRCSLLGVMGDRHGEVAPAARHRTASLDRIRSLGIHLPTGGALQQSVRVRIARAAIFLALVERQVRRS
jgi:hypothetical protein